LHCFSNAILENIENKAVSAAGFVKRHIIISCVLFDETFHKNFNKGFLLEMNKVYGIMELSLAVMFYVS